MKNKILVGIMSAVSTLCVMSSCTNEGDVSDVMLKANSVRFTAVAPQGMNSRALWDSNPVNGKLGFQWETESDTQIDLWWNGFVSSQIATLSEHDGDEAIVTAADIPTTGEIVATFPSGNLTTWYGDKAYKLPAQLVQGNYTDTKHLRDYMYLHGTLSDAAIAEGATMQLEHVAAVLRFLIANGTSEDVRITKVEMLAAEGKSGVNTVNRLSNGGMLNSEFPMDMTVSVQNANGIGCLLKPGKQMSVFAHCFPTKIEDGQFKFRVSYIDANGAVKICTTKEAFSVANITTEEGGQKMFKAGYYYTFNLDINNTDRFEEASFIDMDACSSQEDFQGAVAEFLEGKTGTVDMLLVGKNENLMHVLPSALNAWKGDDVNKFVNLTMRDITLVGALDKCVALKTVSLPSVKTINSNCFNNCTSLVSITAPVAEEVCQNAFNNCTSLVSANFPKVAELGEYVFNGCTQLASVVLPEVTEVGKCAFCACSSLTSINLPNVETLKEGTFMVCSSLETADFSKVSALETNVFDGCYSLKELTFRSRIYKWAEDVLGRVGGGQAEVVVPENVTLTLAKNQNHFDKYDSGWLVNYNKYVEASEKTFGGYTFKKIIVLP